MKAPVSKPSSGRQQPSHADILARIEESAKEREAFHREVREILARNGDAASRALQEIAAVARAVHVVSETVENLEDKLGEEPDSEGHGGRGLIGDMRKTARDLQGLVDLKNRGLGAVAAVALFGTLILWGIIYWVQRIVPAKVKTAMAVLPWG